MVTLPPTPAAAAAAMREECVRALLKRAADAVDGHETALALRLLIEAVQTLIEGNPARSSQRANREDSGCCHVAQQLGGPAEPS